MVPPIARAAYQVLIEDGPSEFLKRGTTYSYKIGLRKLHALTGKADQGTPIYERDWDVFVILDACRVDALREVADEYEFIDTVDTFQSLGSASHEWMEANFKQPEDYQSEYEETVMVTGNPFSDDLLDDGQFQHLEEVWRNSWDFDHGTIRPRPITDRAIDLHRDLNPERMIVHYMQPHVPFVPAPELSQPLDRENWGTARKQKTVWERVRDGELDKEDAWQGYLDNLRYVLDDVEVLLNNIDADTVVLTSDHGEAVGERHLYGHPIGIAIDPLRTVPWATTTATDSGDYAPSESAAEGDEDSDVSREEQLQNLGYLD